MDKRQDAISRAKQAAMSSVSFGMKASDVQSDKLKRSAFVAAKEAVLFRKNIELLITRFKVLDSIILNVKKVLSSKVSPDKKLARITSIIIADGNKFKQAEAILEEKSSVSSLIKSVTKDVTKATIGAAAFALALPYLLSPKLREYVKTFFQGFLDGLGLTTDNLKKLKIGVIAAATVIGGIFTLKALNVVLTSFNKMKRLAQLLGILATVTDSGLDDIDIERKKKVDKLKKAKKLKRIITAASTILKGTVLAYAIGVSIDAVAGTIIDTVVSDDEVVPENIIKVLVNNFIESATFGAVSGPFKTTGGDEAPKADNSKPATSAPAPGNPMGDWNNDPNVIEVSPVTEKSPASSTSTSKTVTPVKQEPIKKDSPVTPPQNLRNESSVQGLEGNITPENISIANHLGNQINNLSSIVNEHEESIIGNNLILVNNSTTVYQNTKQERIYPSLAYSTSVSL